MNDLLDDSLNGLWRWPALAGAAALAGEDLHCALGIWGKVHGAASDYRWIARGPGFGAGCPDLHRYLRIGAEDRAVRTTAWRAPWAAALDYFAIGTYPSRALDAAGRGAVLEKWVLHWRRPQPGFPVALAAAALLPVVAQGDDGPWWERIGEGDWQRPDYVLALGSDACPPVRLDRAGLEGVIAAGIEALLAALDQPRLAAVYAGLLAGSRPVLPRGLQRPLPPGALAALLLPLSPAQAERRSLCAWVPATLIDPRDLGRNWDLAGTQDAGPGPDLAPAYQERGALLAAALYARDPGLLTAQGPGARASRPRAGESAGGTPTLPPVPGIHPHPRLHLEPAAPERPALRYLHEFADSINLRRLDLARLAADLAAPAAWPLLAPDEAPSGHPLSRWIVVLQERCLAGVDAADWAFKIDQLRAAALFLLPHPDTLDLVGLPQDQRVPALLAALAADPAAVGDHLAAHGTPALRRLLEHSRACPDASLASDIRTWMQRWLAATANPDLARALSNVL